MATNNPESTESAHHIQLSGAQTAILADNNVVEELQRLFMQRGVVVDTVSLHTDRITVLSGSAEVARQCLESVAPSWRLPLEDGGRGDVELLLSSVHTRYGSRFALSFDDADVAVIACHHSVREQVAREAENLWTGEKAFPLPHFLAVRLRNTLQDFMIRFNSHFSFEVLMEIVSSWDESQEFLKLTCRRSILPEASRILLKMLAAFHFRLLEVPRALVSFLDACEHGKVLLKAVESSTGCSITMRTVGSEHIVLSACADCPARHKIKLCEGMLGASESDVLVLPLFDDWTEWPSEFRVILQRGMLHTDITHYTSQVGPAPGRSLLALQCQGRSQGQRLIVMRVPPSAVRDRAGFETEAVELCQRVLRHDSVSGRSVAFPLDWGCMVSADVISLVVCRAVIIMLGEVRQPLTVSLYNSGDQRTPNLQPFFDSKPGGLRWICTVSPHVENYGLERVKVVIGNILDYKGDAVVNPTDRELEHKRGQVSRLLLGKAGPELVSVCKAAYPRGMDDEQLLAVTESCRFSTHFRYIFHIVPLQSGHSTAREEQVEKLFAQMHACLVYASLLNLTSIVFPALGTGTLGCEPSEQCWIMLEACRHFFLGMPHSSLEQVTIVCYHSNREVVKAYRAQETLHRFARNRTVNCVSECRMAVSKGLVQVIMGDPTAQACTADNLLCYDPPATGIPVRDYLTKKAESCTTHIINSSNSRDLTLTIKDLIKKVNGTSVQINLETFGSDLVQKVVAGVEKGMNKNIVLVTLVVPSCSVFDQVKSKLKQSGKSVSNNTTNQKKVAVIGVCGNSYEDVKSAIGEVKKIRIPNEYAQADEVDLHPRFICMQEPDSVEDSAVPTQSDRTLATMYINDAPLHNSQVQEECEVNFVVPTEIRENPEHLARLIKTAERFNLSVSISQSSCRLNGNQRQMQLFYRQLAQLMHDTESTL